jgi:hypothetical protein
MRTAFWALPFSWGLKALAYNKRGKGGSCIWTLPLITHASGLIDVVDLKVLSVLRSGGEFCPAHVQALQSMCQQFLPVHNFFCLSDVEIPGTETLPLKYGWPGWWSKMELFRLAPPILYFDLDTVLLGDCRPILAAVSGQPFVILRDVYRGRTDPGAMQSSLMYWEQPMDFLYEQFSQSQAFLPGGDQIFLERVLRERRTPVAYWQDLTGGIVSYKADRRQSGAKPEDRIVIFHGRPRPWEQSAIDYAIRKPPGLDDAR